MKKDNIWNKIKREVGSKSKRARIKTYFHTYSTDQKITEYRVILNKNGTTCL